LPLLKPGLVQVALEFRQTGRAQFLLQVPDGLGDDGVALALEIG